MAELAESSEHLDTATMSHLSTAPAETLCGEVLDVHQLPLPHTAHADAPGGIYGRRLHAPSAKMQGTVSF
eukprot:CAMPEP_0170653500 /NCGR_PEP_ID=MMETSP0224-20130122/47439_1 /TAXON_ID=285029 /ORGANISM="Togula jolla, Strain CCCM 725" /LENGTH=69 /DNA_ID=CAMNT_0010985373 /DNA_START=384 /DNA_END=593 /DNA_ORIENTATION=+